MERLINKENLHDLRSICFFNRHTGFTKTVAIVISLLFIVQNTALAETAPLLWRSIKTHKDYTGDDVIGDIQIPYSAATPRESFIRKGSGTVINIQDAHSSVSAQHSIVSILDSLSNNYDLDLVALEGAEGPLDDSLLKTFPDLDIRKDTAEYLLRKGKLSAGEFFSITSEKDITLYGVEDNALYQANLNAFNSVIEKRLECVKNIKAFRSALKAFEDKIYSKELREFNKTANLHKKGVLAFADYLNYLSRTADLYGLKKYTSINLSKLLRSMGLEKNIDFIKANEERKQLIDELSKKVSQETLKDLVLKSLEFKQSKISQGAFHSYLIGLADSSNIPSKGYEDLIRFTEYILSYEEVDIAKLTREIDGFEESLRARMFKTADERGLFERIQTTEIIERLFEVSLSNKDNEYINEHKEYFNKHDLSDFIETMSSKYNVFPEDAYDLDVVFDNMSEAIEFYNIAEKRNAAIIENTIKLMKENNESMAALITGGFHSKGMSELMKSRNLSYLILMPKYKEGEERPYIAILTNKRKPYEKLLETGEYTLAVRAYFYTGDSRQLLESIFYSLGRAETEDMDIINIKKTWLNAFTSSYNALSQNRKGWKIRPVTPKTLAKILGLKVNFSKENTVISIAPEPKSGIRTKTIEVNGEKVIIVREYDKEGDVITELALMRGENGSYNLDLVPKEVKRKIERSKKLQATIVKKLTVTGLKDIKKLVNGVGLSNNEQSERNEIFQAVISRVIEKGIGLKGKFNEDKLITIFHQIARRTGHRLPSTKEIAADRDFANAIIKGIREAADKAEIAPPETLKATDRRKIRRGHIRSELDDGIVLTVNDAKKLFENALPGIKKELLEINKAWSGKDTYSYNTYYNDLKSLDLKVVKIKGKNYYYSKNITKDLLLSRLIARADISLTDEEITSIVGTEAPQSVDTEPAPTGTSLVLYDPSFVSASWDMPELSLIGIDHEENSVKSAVAEARVIPALNELAGKIDVAYEVKRFRKLTGMELPVNVDAALETPYGGALVLLAIYREFLLFYDSGEERELIRAYNATLPSNKRDQRSLLLRDELLRVIMHIIEGGHYFGGKRIPEVGTYKEELLFENPEYLIFLIGQRATGLRGFGIDDIDMLFNLIYHKMHMLQSSLASPEKGTTDGKDQIDAGQTETGAQTVIKYPLEDTDAESQDEGSTGGKAESVHEDTGSSVTVKPVVASTSERSDKSSEDVKEDSVITAAVIDVYPHTEDTQDRKTTHRNNKKNKKILRKLIVSAALIVLAFFIPAFAVNSTGVMEGQSEKPVYNLLDNEKVTEAFRTAAVERIKGVTTNELIKLRDSLKNVRDNEAKKTLLDELKARFPYEAKLADMVMSREEQLAELHPGSRAANMLDQIIALRLQETSKVEKVDNESRPEDKPVAEEPKEAAQAQEDTTGKADNAKDIPGGDIREYIDRSAEISIKGNRCVVIQYKKTDDMPDALQDKLILYLVSDKATPIGYIEQGSAQISDDNKLIGNPVIVQETASPYTGTVAYERYLHVEDGMIVARSEKTVPINNGTKIKKSKFNAKGKGQSTEYIFTENNKVIITFKVHKNNPGEVLIHMAGNATMGNTAFYPSIIGQNTKWRGIIDENGQSVSPQIMPYISDIAGPKTERTSFDTVRYITKSDQLKDLNDNELVRMALDNMQGRQAFRVLRETNDLLDLFWQTKSKKFTTGNPAANAAYERHFPSLMQRKASGEGNFWCNVVVKTGGIRQVIAGGDGTEAHPGELVEDIGGTDMLRNKDQNIYETGHYYIRKFTNNKHVPENLRGKTIAVPASDPTKIKYFLDPNTVVIKRNGEVQPGYVFVSYARDDYPRAPKIRAILKEGATYGEAISLDKFKGVKGDFLIVNVARVGKCVVSSDKPTKILAVVKPGTLKLDPNGKIQSSPVYVEVIKESLPEGNGDYFSVPYYTLIYTFDGRRVLGAKNEYDLIPRAYGYRMTRREFDAEGNTLYAEHIYYDGSNKKISFTVKKNSPGKVFIERFNRDGSEKSKSIWNGILAPNGMILPIMCDYDPKTDSGKSFEEQGTPYKAPKILTPEEKEIRKHLIKSQKILRTFKIDNAEPTQRDIRIVAAMLGRYKDVYGLDDLYMGQLITKICEQKDSLDTLLEALTNPNGFEQDDYSLSNTWREYLEILNTQDQDRFDKTIRNITGMTNEELSVRMFFARLEIEKQCFKNDLKQDKMTLYRFSKLFNTILLYAPDDVDQYFKDMTEYAKIYFDRHGHRLNLNDPFARTMILLGPAYLERAKKGDFGTIESAYAQQAGSGEDIVNTLNWVRAPLNINADGSEGVDFKKVIEELQSRFGYRKFDMPVTLEQKIALLCMTASSEDFFTLRTYDKRNKGTNFIVKSEKMGIIYSWINFARLNRLTLKELQETINDIKVMKGWGDIVDKYVPQEVSQSNLSAHIRYLEQMAMTEAGLDRIAGGAQEMRARMEQIKGLYGIYRDIRLMNDYIREIATRSGMVQQYNLRMGMAGLPAGQAISVEQQIYSLGLRLDSLASQIATDQKINSMENAKNSLIQQAALQKEMIQIRQQIFERTKEPSMRTLIDRLKVASKDTIRNATFVYWSKFRRENGLSLEKLVQLFKVSDRLELNRIEALSAVNPGMENIASGKRMAIALDLMQKGEGSDWAVYFYSDGTVKNAEARDAVNRIFNTADTLSRQHVKALEGDDKFAEGRRMAIAMDRIREGESSDWALFINEEGLLLHFEAGQKLEKVFDISDMLDNSGIEALEGEDTFTDGKRMAIALSVIRDGSKSGWSRYIGANAEFKDNDAVRKIEQIFEAAETMSRQNIRGLSGTDNRSDGIRMGIAMDLIGKGASSDWARYLRPDGRPINTEALMLINKIFEIKDRINVAQLELLTGKPEEEIKEGHRIAIALGFVKILQDELDKDDTRLDELIKAMLKIAGKTENFTADDPAYQAEFDFYLSIEMSKAETLLGRELTEEEKSVIRSEAENEFPAMYRFSFIYAKTKSMLKTIRDIREKNKKMHGAEAPESEKTPEPEDEANVLHKGAVSHYAAIFGLMSLGAAVSRTRGNGGYNSVVIGIPLIFGDEDGIQDTQSNREEIAKTIYEFSDGLPAEFDVVFFTDEGDEDNLRFVTDTASQRQALMGVPVRSGIDMDTLLQEIKSGFLRDVNMQLVQLVNADIQNPELNARTRETLMSSEQADENGRIVIGDRLNNMLPPIFSEQLTLLSLYNLRIINLSRDLSVEKLPEAAAEYLEKDVKHQHIVSMRADSVGEMKMLAEQHRKRMEYAKNMNEDEDPDALEILPVRLEIRLTVAKEDESRINENNKINMLRMMGIDDVLDPEDLILVPEDSVKEMTLNKIYENLTAKGYNSEQMAVVDRIEEDMKTDRIPENMIYAEYTDAMVTPYHYDAVLELIARPDELTLSDRHEGWFRIRPIAAIDYDELKKELERYKKVLMAA